MILSKHKQCFLLYTAKVITVELYDRCQDSLAIFFTRLVLVVVIWMVFKELFNFSMCFPNFWLDVYILSQSLQSNFPMSILWVRLCCVRYLFCVNVFSHVSQLNIITAVFLTFTMSPPQFNWCFCKLSFRVYTFSHFSHPNLLSKWVFMCLASSPFATPLSQTLHFSIVLTFPMCFFKIYAVWNFLSQMLQLDSFFWW